MAESSNFFCSAHDTKYFIIIQNQVYFLTLNNYEKIMRNDNRGDFYGYHYYSKRL